MDLTGQPGLITQFTVDDLTGIVTLTLRDITDTTTLGTIQIEDIKLRSLCEALLRMVEVRWPNNISRTGQKTIYTVAADQGKTEFA